MPGHDLPPELLDAYLVTVHPSSVPIGVVRRDGAVWRVFRFGVPDEQQPPDVFASREDAGVWLQQAALA